MFRFEFKMVFKFYIFFGNIIRRQKVYVFNAHLSELFSGPTIIFHSGSVGIDDYPCLRIDQKLDGRVILKEISKQRLTLTQCLSGESVFIPFLFSFQSC